MKIFTIILDYLFLFFSAWYFWGIKDYFIKIIDKLFYSSIEPILFSSHLMVFFVSVFWVILLLFILKINIKIFKSKK